MNRSAFNIKTVITFALTLGGIAYFVISLSEQPGSVELQQGQRIMYQVMGQETLREAGFYQAQPQGRPSDFVEFARTSQGRRLWPQTTAEYREKQQVPGVAGRGPGRVLQPVHLSFSAHNPDPSAGKQIVYAPLDETGQMEIRGYESPNATPAFVITFDFPTDAGRVPLQ